MVRACPKMPAFEHPPTPVPSAYARKIPNDEMDQEWTHVRGASETFHKAHKWVRQITVFSYVGHGSQAGSASSKETSQEPAGPC